MKILKVLLEVNIKLIFITCALIVSKKENQFRIKKILNNHKIYL